MKTLNLELFPASREQSQDAPFLARNPCLLKPLLGYSKITTTDGYYQLEASVVPISSFNLWLAASHTRQDHPAIVSDIPRIKSG